MSSDGGIRLSETLLVVIPCVAREGGSRTDVGPSLDRRGAGSGRSAHGTHRGDPVWRGLHGAVGGEEVTVAGGLVVGVVAGGKSEVLGECFVQVFIIRL